MHTIISEGSRISPSGFDIIDVGLPMYKWFSGDPFSGRAISPAIFLLAIHAPGHPHHAELGLSSCEGIRRKLLPPLLLHKGMND